VEYDVAVIGAGPGGCATAYHLRQAGWKVLLVERRRHPVDKLCGEFLSPEGITSLKRMGLELQNERDIFPIIRDVAVSSTAGSAWQAPLPAPGLGISRKYLDRILMERCAESGVEVVQGVKITRVHGTVAGGFCLQGQGVSYPARLAVAAYGKQSPLQNLLGDKSRATGKWMALKLHHRGAFPQERVELHNFPGGYAGLCRVEDGRVNLCLLTRISCFRAVGGDCRSFVREVLCRNPLLAQRLQQLEGNWDEVIAVANLFFGQVQRAADGVALVGDAAGAISPLCGDGMAMALRTGEMIAPLADRYLRGIIAGEQFLQRYDAQWQAEFRWRLGLGKMLQALLARPFGARAAIALLRSFPALGAGLVRATRGGSRSAG
jgi:flavin-dependent dehydrogenase